MPDAAWRKGYAAAGEGLQARHNPYARAHKCTSAMGWGYYRENNAHYDWQRGYEAWHKEHEEARP